MELTLKVGLLHNPSKICEIQNFSMHHISITCYHDNQLLLVTIAYFSTHEKHVLEILVSLIELGILQFGTYLILTA